jgi:Protein of unknown function (DUF3775)
MLRDLNIDQARFIVLLAKSARTQRDAMLGHVAEKSIGGTTPARGEHNPTAELGFEPLPAREPQTAAPREAIASLPAAARQELYALMRIGQGHLAAKKWHHGLTEAESLGPDVITAALMGDPDLHDHLAKAFYEAKLPL